MRAERRGLRAVLDPATYVTRLWEGAHWGDPPLNDEATRRTLQQLHPSVLKLHDVQKRRTDTPLGLALATARAKVRGPADPHRRQLPGPDRERHPGPDPRPGRGAGSARRREVGRRRHAGQRPAVRRAGPRRPQGQGDQDQAAALPRRPAAPMFCTGPFQPTGGLPWMNWRKSADRVLVTLQDLIAYSVGRLPRPAPGLDALPPRRPAVGSQGRRSGGDLPRRRRRTCGASGCLWSPSAPSSSRTAPTTSAVTSPRRSRPSCSPAAGRRATSWSCSAPTTPTRTVTWRSGSSASCREQNPSLGLVLAGVAVAEGSSRVLEAIELRDTDGVVTLPDVTSEERNWLLRHASICLYPTSNEGFGLVPVRGRPVRHPDRVHPGRPAGRGARRRARGRESWDPDELAECCQRLLDDPQLATEQVTATLKCGEPLHLGRDRRPAGPRLPRAAGAAGPMTATTPRHEERHGKPRPRQPGRRRRPIEEQPVKNTADLDDISLDQALLDVDVANARVIDLTKRLTALTKELRKTTSDLQKAKLRNRKLSRELEEIKERRAPSARRPPPSGSLERLARPGWAGDARADDRPPRPARHHRLQRRGLLRAHARLRAAHRPRRRRARRRSSSTTASPAPGFSQWLAAHVRAARHRLLPQPAQPGHPAQRLPRACSPRSSRATTTSSSATAT